MTAHAEIVAEICRAKSGIIPLRSLLRIAPGKMLRVSNTQGLDVGRAERFDRLGLAKLFVHPSGAGSRTWRSVSPTLRTVAYVDLCREASLLSNLSWLEPDRGAFWGRSYLDWRQEWLDRRDAFRRALVALAPERLATTDLIPELEWAG